MHRVEKSISEIIRIDGVSYTFEGEISPILRNLSCVIYEKGINLIVGPSGCGKSTILNLIDGIVPHFYQGKLEGGIYFKGENIKDLEPRDRCGSIGYVMQSPDSQFCTFTVEEEIAFGMENMMFDKNLIESRIKEVLDLVGMSGFEKRNLNNLSGGQKQKIAIASILALKPDVILMDEPTANLDPESRKQIFDLIIKCKVELGISVVLVEHNISEIFDEVDNVIQLDRNGSIVYQGEVNESLRNSILKKSYPEFTNKVKNEEKNIVISIKDLIFSYSGKKSTAKNIINGLNLSIFENEFLAIIGQNGTGKTTLTKLILGMEKSNYGCIEIFGKKVEKYRKKDLYTKIGLVFQNPENQFIKDTVYKDMLFSLNKKKVDESKKIDMVDNMLRRYHLLDFKERSPFVLSQGQKRRLSVAQMLLTGQRIIFLDEPTYGQDWDNRVELMSDMKALQNEGCTIVIITHDIELAKKYADRIVKMEKGRIIEG